MPRHPPHRSLFLSHIPTGRGAVGPTARRAPGWIRQSRKTHLYGFCKKSARELPHTAMAREVPPGLGRRPWARGGRAAPPWALGELPERPTLHLPTDLPYTALPGRPPCTSRVAYPTPTLHRAPGSPTLHLPRRLPYASRPTYPTPRSQGARPAPPNRPTLYLFCSHYYN